LSLSSFLAINVTITPSSASAIAVAFPIPAVLPQTNAYLLFNLRGAVANWSKTLANELGQFGITVNNVLPGATGTERLTEIIKNKSSKTGKTETEAADAMKNAVPAKRFAKPEELADAITFLASERAGYINGINLPVDGGRTKSL